MVVWRMVPRLFRLSRRFGVLLLGLLLLGGCQREGPSTASTPVELRGESIDAPVESPASAAAGAPGAVGGLGLRLAPTDPAERAALAAEAPAPTPREGYRGVGFAELADFPFEVDLDGRALPGTELPSEISRLDGQKVAVSGFAIPIEFESDRVRSLILVRNQLLCCYGEEPALNEWVFVHADPPLEAVNDIPVTLYGTFYASPDEEDGQVISLYRMEAEDLEVIR